MAASTLDRHTRRRPVTGFVLMTCLWAIVFAPIYCLALAYATASRWTHPHREASTVTPAAYGLSFENIALATEDALHLAAWYVPPSNGAAVVMLHGLGGNRGATFPFAADLASRGYGLLLLDLRAHGESDGSVSTLGLHEVRDVRAAIEYLKGRPEVDEGRIGVYGASLGAATAIMAAAELPEIRAVVADSGFASIDWVVAHEFEQLETVPAWLAPLVVAMGSWQMGVDSGDIAPVRQIARISPRPTMIVHGELDATFTVNNAFSLADVSGEPTELWIGSGVGHTGLYATDPGAYVERVAGFFDRSIGRAQVSQAPGRDQPSQNSAQLLAETRAR